jgi:hypothetical protein
MGEPLRNANAVMTFRNPAKGQIMPHVVELRRPLATRHHVLSL